MTTAREYLQKRIRSKGDLQSAIGWLRDNEVGWDTELSTAQFNDMKSKLNAYGKATARSSL